MLRGPAMSAACQNNLGWGAPKHTALMRQDTKLADRGMVVPVHIIKHGSWILPFYFLPFHSNLFASCNLCLFKECWKVSVLKTMRSNTKTCQYKSITQCNLSQQDLVLECLEGLRFFYTAGSSSGQGPGRGWHCLYSRLLI